MEEEKYKISCLCVTRKRPKQLRRAIGCFNNQTYINKELVVVYQDDDSETDDLLATADVPDLVKVKIKYDKDRTLGESRNISIKESTGDYFCQWDDDDWYHEDRLKVQLESALRNKKEASILYFWLMYDFCTNQAYLSHRRLWEASILCRKDVVEYNRIAYPKINKGEDTEFIDALINIDILFPLINPQLYIYTHSGTNTSGTELFNKMFEYGQMLSQYHSGELQKILTGVYGPNEAANALNADDFMRPLKYTWLKTR